MTNRRDSPSVSPPAKTEGRAPRRGARAQAMIETVVAVMFLCLTFLWLYQYAHLFTVKLVLNHAAARAARARAVGLNELMVWKSARVATIPVAGKCLSTFDGDALSPQEEANRVPRFLAAEDYAEARGTLDYELWDVTGIDVSESGFNGGSVEVTVSQLHPRLFDYEAFATGRAVSDEELEADAIPVEATYSIENHYPYYMNNEGL